MKWCSFLFFLKISMIEATNVYLDELCRKLHFGISLPMCYFPVLPPLNLPCKCWSPFLFIGSKSVSFVVSTENLSKCWQVHLFYPNLDFSNGTWMSIAKHLLNTFSFVCLRDNQICQSIAEVLNPPSSTSMILFCPRNLQTVIKWFHQSPRWLVKLNKK